MNHADHMFLLREAVTGGVWADLGSGHGAFTLALADLIGSDGEIFSIDKDAGALARQETAMVARFPRLAVTYLAGHFRKPFVLPPLDGIVMANSLHFVKHKEPVVQLAASYLKPGGQIVLVEYNTDAGNRWVPHPLSFDTWRQLAGRYGLLATHKLAAVPSRFLGEIYSAQSRTARTV